MTASLLEQLADLPKAEVDALIRAMAPGEATAFEYDWRYRARPEQLPPAGSWRVWLLVAGRGFGKTRSGAEWVRAEVKADRPGGADCGRCAPGYGRGRIRHSGHFA